MIELTEKDLVLIDKEFITDQFDTYESDLVYKVYTKEGVVYLFFLLELQSYNDFTMPFRLLVYMTAIWLDHFKNCDKNKRSKKGYRLPAIMPIVLHNSERNWTASCRFSHMINNAQLFGKYVVDFEYALVSVNTLTESKISNSNGKYLTKQQLCCKFTNKFLLFQYSIPTNNICTITARTISIRLMTLVTNPT